MKVLFKLMAIASAMLSAFQLSAYDFMVDGIAYKINGDHVAICEGSKPTVEVLTIPSEVTHDGITYAVTGISNYGLGYCNTLRHVIIPPTITSINNDAFSYSNNLQVITIDASLKSICSDSFANIPLTTLIIEGEGALNPKLNPNDRGSLWWQVGSVKNLVIGSGVTSLPSFKNMNPSDIFCYATVPPGLVSDTFSDYGARLHVPAESMAAYFSDENWKRFAKLSNDVAQLQSLELAQSDITLEYGHEFKIEPIVNPSSVYQDALQYMTSKYGTVTVDADGVVKAVNVGECDVIVSCLDKFAVCHVTVPYPDDFVMTISQSEAVLYEGNKKLKLSADISVINAMYAMAPTWTSSNPSVAAITYNNDGTDMFVDRIGGDECVVTARGYGECDIIATETQGGRSVSCHIVVPDQIEIDRRQAAIGVGKMVTITPTLIPVGCTFQATCSDDNLAAVRIAGGLLQVLGLQPGMVSVTLSDSRGKAKQVVSTVLVVADLNDDGALDVGDVNLTLEEVLANGNDGKYDLNNDSKVDVGDVNLLLQAILESEDIH